MNYTTRIVRSNEGLTKEAALLGLQEHPSFMPGTKIANIYNQGGRWVAKLLEPKTAEVDVEPCEHCEDKGCQHCKKTAAGPFEDLDESPAEVEMEEHEEHEESESPLEELEEHEHGESEDDEDSDSKKLKELEKKLDLLLDALGISEKGDEPEVPEVEGPTDLPAAPESGPKSEPLPPGSGAKLKPGEVPNKPGMTPVGAPAFASVRHADASTPPNSAVANPSSGPSTAGPTAAPQNFTEEQMNAQQQQQLAQKPSNPSQPAPPSTVMSFTASRPDRNRTLSIRQAKAALENEFGPHGYRVARIKRDDVYIHAQMVR